MANTDKIVREPIAEYRFFVDLDWYRQMLARGRKANGATRWLFGSRGALMIFLGTFGIGAMLAKVPPVAFICLFLIALLSIGPRFDYWLLERRFSHSVDFGTSVTMQFSEDGYIGENSNGRSERSWKYFLTATRFPDGILLNNEFWLPDSKLSAGSITAVEDLIRKHVPKFRRL